MGTNTEGYKNFIAQYPNKDAMFRLNHEFVPTPDPKEKIGKKRWVGKYTEMEEVPAQVRHRAARKAAQQQARNRNRDQDRDRDAELGTRRQLAHPVATRCTIRHSYPTYILLSFFVILYALFLVLNMLFKFRSSHCLCPSKK